MRHRRHPSRWRPRQSGGRRVRHTADADPLQRVYDPAPFAVCQEADLGTILILVMGLNYLSDKQVKKRRMRAMQAKALN